MTELATARREEAQAIAALLITGQGLRRLLEVIAADSHVPPELRSRASEEAVLWLAGCRRYAEASAARTIARQQSVHSGQRQRKGVRHARPEPEGKREPRDQ